MRNLTRNDSGRVRRIVATGLVPLLLLVSVPGCVARHMPDWSKVQSVAPDTKTEVQLYKEGTSQRSRKIQGRLLSATSDSMTLKFKDGQIGTFQKKKIRKVLAQRELGKRWPGWLALGISLAFGMQTMRAEADFVPSAQVLFGVALPVGISIPFFLGSKMGGIYEVPPEHRDWYPQETRSVASGTEKPEQSK